MRPQLLSAFTLASIATVASAQPLTCNGFSELCSRRYSNVTFIGSHDSPFVGQGISDNQNIPIAEQLAMGVRFFQAQTHELDGTIELCHSHCMLRDAGPLADMLTTIESFLNGNPDEVVTLLLTNEGHFGGPAFDAVFKAVGLDAYAFCPQGSLQLGEWPTLGEMVASAKRLVVFIGT